MNNNYNRNYNVDAYKKEEDRRFILCKKEAIFAQTMVWATMFLALGLGYLFCPIQVKEMTYFLGFPPWFIVSTAVILFTFVVMLIFNSKKSKHFSLDAKEISNGGLKDERN